MRISSKGQVTIPAKIRERAGLLPGTEVAFEFDGEGRGHRSGQSSDAAMAAASELSRIRGAAMSRCTDAIMALTRA